MLTIILWAALIAALYWTVFPASFLGEHKRKTAFLWAIIIGVAISGMSDANDPAKPIEQGVVAPEPPQQNAVTSKSVSPVTAILGKKSLFTDVRHSEKIYCAADGPSWIVAELDGEFVAINGTARSWASNGHLSVYRAGEWITVKDRGVNPSNIGSDKLNEMIKTGLALCPMEGKGSFLDQVAERLEQGSARYIDRGKSYGLAPEQSSQAINKKIVRINGFGCVNADRFDRILSLHGAGDKKAAQNLLALSLVSQDCVQLTQGRTVFVEDISIWRQTRCVRPEGEVTCYWTTKVLTESEN